MRKLYDYYREWMAVERMIVTNAIVFAFGLVWLVGCASPLDSYSAGPMGLPQRLPEVNAPTAPTDTEEAAWDAAGGGVDVIEGTLSLERCVELALAQNPGLKSVSDEAGQASAESDLARSTAWPKLDAVAGYTHTLDAQRLVGAHRNGEAGVFANDVISSDLVLSMPIFTGGQITHRIKASEILKAAAEHRLSRTKRELIFNVTSLYYGILAQERLIESDEFSRKAIERQRDRIAELIKVQKAAKVDLLRTEVRLSNIKQQLIAQRNRLEIQRRTLGTLLGIREKSVKVAGDLEAEVVIPTERPSTDESLAQREDYLAAFAAVEAERHQFEAAKGARWPQISAGASYGGRFGLDADGPSGTDDIEDVGTVGVFGTVPIFDGGEIASQVLKERFQLSADRQRLHGLELQIDLEIETAWRNVQSADERVKATTTAVAQGEESLRIEQEKYELAKGTIVDVLDAQSALLEAQTTYYQALADRQIALAQLELAMGSVKS